MKLTFIVIAGLIICYSAYVSLGGDGSDVFGDGLKKEIASIFDKYENSAYKSLYSLDEIRSYSIIQLNKTSEMYENDWLEPKSIVRSLTEKERAKLRKSLINYMENDVQVREQLPDRIISWSSSDKLFEVLRDYFNISENEILNVLVEHNKTSFIINKFDQRSANKMESLTEKQKDEAFNIALNYISALERKEQLRYYSEFFNLLSAK